MKSKELLFSLILFVTGLVVVLNTTTSHANPLPDESTDIELVEKIALEELGKVQQDSWPCKTFEIGELRQEESWAFLNLLCWPEHQTDPSAFAPSIVLLAVAYKEDNKWHVYIEGTTGFQHILTDVPDTLLSEESKSALQNTVSILESISPHSMNATTNYTIGLPWQPGQAWRFNQSLHSGAIDFGTPSCGNPGDVYTADSGVVILAKGTCMTVRRSDGLEMFYQHINSNDINNWQLGNFINANTSIGETTMASGCGGTTSGHHLHFQLKNGGSYVADGSNFGGWTLQNPSFKRGNETRTASTACSGENNWLPYDTPTGYIDSPLPGAWRNGTVRIEGWAKVAGGTINQVEIWIDGSHRDNAIYGTPRPDVGGNFGYYWDWDISQYADGNHTIQVKAVANNGTSIWLIVSSTSNDTILPVKTDNNPPNNPNFANSGCGAANNVWQNSCNDPNFTWSGASDGNGIGLKDYQYYWGTSFTGAPTTYTTNAGVNPGAITETFATYYLRVAARDQLNQQNLNPSTIFVLLYDSVNPTANLLINNGSDTVNQVNVSLAVTANDIGSGVEQVRVSNNGVEWSVWQAYQPGMSIPWVLPSLNRQEHTVYAQVKDRAGNLSTTVSDTIMLELYPLAPHSANYRLCANVVNVAGQAGLGSTTYRLTSNIGEAWIGAATSAGYQGKGGLLADLENCRPIEYVAGEEFILTNSVIASGGSLRGNANYLLGDTVGETAASPKNAFSSNNYQLTSGFWSDVQVGSGAPPPPLPTPIPVTATPMPTPGPTSTPVPTTFSVSIGNGIQFTNNPNVTVRLTAPNVNQVRLSNDGGYADDNWQPYQTNLNWTIDIYGNYVLPRFVYAWFKDTDGIVYGTYFDDIIYDPIAPTGSISLLGGDNDIASLYLPASDDNSGVAEMRVSSDASFSDADWVAYEEVISWDEPQTTVYAQFRDAAGNVSEVYSSEGEINLGSAIYLPMIVR